MATRIVLGFSAAVICRSSNVCDGGHCEMPQPLAANGLLQTKSMIKESKPGWLDVGEPCKGSRDCNSGSCIGRLCVAGATTAAPQFGQAEDDQYYDAAATTTAAATTAPVVPCECTGEAKKGGTCTDYNHIKLWCYVVEGSCPNGGKWSEEPCKAPPINAADHCQCTGESKKGGTCTDYNHDKLWCYVVKGSCPNGGTWSEAPCEAIR